jgi:hypothetical protein
MRRKTVLDTQDGQVNAMSVIDDGTEDLSLGVRAMKAHYYDIRGPVFTGYLVRRA